MFDYSDMKCIARRKYLCCYPRKITNDALLTKFL